MHGVQDAILGERKLSSPEVSTIILYGMPSRETHQYPHTKVVRTYVGVSL